MNGLWMIMNSLGAHLPEALDILKILDKTDIIAPKLMPICVAISYRLLLLSHLIRLCASSMFSSVVASLGVPEC